MIFVVFHPSPLTVCINCFFGRPFVKTVRPVLSDRCPVLSVCDVGVLWPNGWMDQDKLGMEVGLGRVTLCYRDQAPPPQEGAKQPPPLFGQCLLWPNGWMDQDATWYGGRPQSMPHCVRWGPSSPK